MAGNKGKSNIPYILGTAVLGGLITVGLRAVRDRKLGDKAPMWAQQVRKNRKKRT